MEFLLVAARVLLASVFLLAGTAKFVDPVGTRKALRDFGLPMVLARPLVPLLPLVELLAGAALIPTSAAWYGAWGTLSLVVVFMLAVGVAMLRGRKPDCHCFGQLHSAPVGWTTLVRNSLLGAVAAWLITRGKGNSGPEIWTWVASLGSFETKVAAIVGCVLGFLFLRVLVRAGPKSAPAAETSLSFPFFGEDEQPEEESTAEPAPTQPVRPPAAARPAPVESEPKPDVSHPLDIGLPIGTPAPDFELPAISGETRSLQSLREGGKEVLLIFSSPFCKSCEALASNLNRWTMGRTGLPNIVVISRGTSGENTAKLKGLGPGQILLQRGNEVAHAYDCSTTPTGVLVSADGLIRSQLVAGGTAIRQLLLSSAKRDDPGAAKTKSGQRASVFKG